MSILYESAVRFVIYLSISTWGDTEVGRFENGPNVTVRRLFHSTTFYVMLRHYYATGLHFLSMLSFSRSPAMYLHKKTTVNLVSPYKQRPCLSQSLREVSHSERPEPPFNQQTQPQIRMNGPVGWPSVGHNSLFLVLSYWICYFFVFFHWRDNLFYVHISIH